jgi:hypothetical protein
MPVKEGNAAQNAASWHCITLGILLSIDAALPPCCAVALPVGVSAYTHVSNLNLEWQAADIGAKMMCMHAGR